MFDPVCIGYLAEAIKAHDVGLVVTSTWRLAWPLKKIQRRVGPLGACLVGVTPEIDDLFLQFDVTMRRFSQGRMKSVKLTLF